MHNIINYDNIKQELCSSKLFNKINEMSIENLEELLMSSSNLTPVQVLGEPDAPVLIDSLLRHSVILMCVILKEKYEKRIRESN